MSHLDLSSVRNIDIDVVTNLPPYYQAIQQNCTNWAIQEITCQSMSLDQLCRKEGVSKIDLLKLDTQGNEYEILCSMNKQLLSNTAVIYVETPLPHKEHLYENQASFEKIYDFMIANGFELLGAYGLDNFISLEDSIDINCIYINKAIFGETAWLIK